ncbi:MAG: hypothetical protein J3K34DRAFT_414982 [Monoraphidium minutum]|nr:MAG: hypothetical protein J3K34DRAFT_414982 [Monoraphidium minutum]
MVLQWFANHDHSFALPDTLLLIRAHLMSFTRPGGARRRRARPRENGGACARVRAHPCAPAPRQLAAACAPGPLPGLPGVSRQDPAKSHLPHPAPTLKRRHPHRPPGPPQKRGGGAAAQSVSQRRNHLSLPPASDPSPVLPAACPPAGPRPCFAAKQTLTWRAPLPTALPGLAKPPRPSPRAPPDAARRRRARG